MSKEYRQSPQAFGKEINSSLELLEGMQPSQQLKFKTSDFRMERE
jgi:hypothetical protein